MRRDSSFCAKSVRYNMFTNGAPYSGELTMACKAVSGHSESLLKIDNETKGNCRC